MFLGTPVTSLAAFPLLQRIPAFLFGQHLPGLWNGSLPSTPRLGDRRHFCPRVLDTSSESSCRKGEGTLDCGLPHCPPALSTSFP